MLEFIESPQFSKACEKYLVDDEFAKLQAALADNPMQGDLIRGSGGVRKMRWNRQGMGKRGGLRILYYYLDHAGKLWLLDLYAKNERSTLLGQQARKLKKDETGN